MYNVIIVVFGQGSYDTPRNCSALISCFVDDFGINGRIWGLDQYM